MAVPQLGKMKSRYLNVHYIEGFKNVISQRYGLNCKPTRPNSYVEVLTPSASVCDLI